MVTVRHAAFATLVAALLAPAAPRADDTFDIQLLDATVRDKAIGGAQIILQKAGETSVTATSAAGGAASLRKPFGGVDDASVTLIAKKDGYSPLVVRCPCDGLTYALSPVQASLDGLRIVLNWGEQPEDLDSHLVYESQHVFYQAQRGRDANLDVDDTTSYGPETITIEKKHPGARYVYAVHDFTHGEQQGSTALSTGSRAKVFVYVGSSLVRTFRPPSGVKGNVWAVFAVGENGEFYDINRFYDVRTRSEVAGALAQILTGGPMVSSPVLEGDAKTRAAAVNAEGEKAYHAKRLDESVQLYTEAIDLDPEYAQAYSNLGLSQQKLGRRAEALWANRKAIALAAGPTAAVVKASSWYNIASVLEQQGEWQQALDAYQAALSFRTHDAYTKGIARMKQKLGK